MEFACILEVLIDKNHTLKRMIAKICQETNLTSDRVFLVELFRIRMGHRSRLQVSPYEILYGRPFLYSEQFGSQTYDQKVKEVDTVRYVQTLGLVLNAILKFATKKK